MQACLEKGKKILENQEVLNQGAPAGAFRQGERFFGEWLERDSVKGWSREAASRVALGTDTTGLTSRATSCGEQPQSAIAKTTAHRRPDRQLISGSHVANCPLRP